MARENSIGNHRAAEVVKLARIATNVKVVEFESMLPQERITGYKKASTEFEKEGVAPWRKKA